MDPQAAWGQLLAAYAAGDWDILEERATDLIEWLDRGGFPPMILKQPDIDPELNRALARAGCFHALGILKDEWCVRADVPSTTSL